MIKFKSRHITAENIDKLADEIDKNNWSEVTQTKDPNKTYNIFHTKITKLLDKLYQ